MAQLDHIPKEIRILVVDDFSTIRRVLKNILKQLGFTNVDEAESSKIALGKLRSEKYEFVIADWNLPQQGGDFCKDLRAEAGLQQLPCLMLMPESKEQRLIKDSGESAPVYLVMPFSADCLAQKLEGFFPRLSSSVLTASDAEA